MLKKLLLTLGFVALLSSAVVMPSFAQTTTQPIPQLYGAPSISVSSGTGQIQDPQGLTTSGTVSVDSTPTADETAGILLVGMMVMAFYASIMCFYCLAILFGLSEFVMKILSIIHCMDNAPEKDRTLWVILILLVPIMGWVYYFTKRKVWVKGKEI